MANPYRTNNNRCISILNKKTALLVSVFLFLGVSTVAANPLTDLVDRFSGEDDFSDDVIERYFEEGIDPSALEKQDGDFSRDIFLLSFGSDDTVEPGDEATYETSIRYNADSGYCDLYEDDYPQQYAIWLEGEGTGIDNTAYEDNGYDDLIYCDGTYTDVNIDIDAPESVGEYEYELYIAPNPYITAYPLFDEKNNFAGSSDLLTVEDPITEPTARISVDSHEATEGDYTTVDTSGTSGDYNQINVEVWRDGEFLETWVGVQDQGHTVSYQFDQPGEYMFEMDVIYNEDEYHMDEDFVTVSVEQDIEPADAEIDIPSSAETGETVTFDGSGSSGEGSIEAYTWYVDGDAVSFDQTAEHVFNEAKTSTVELEVTDSEGQTDTASGTVTVEVSEVEVWTPDIDLETCELEVVEEDSVPSDSFESESECLDYVESQIPDDPVDDDDQGTDGDGDSDQDDDDEQPRGVTAVFWNFVSFLL